MPRGIRFRGHGSSSSPVPLPTLQPLRKALWGKMEAYGTILVYVHIEPDGVLLATYELPFDGWQTVAHMLDLTWDASAWHTGHKKTNPPLLPVNARKIEP